MTTRSMTPTVIPTLDRTPASSGNATCVIENLQVATHDDSLPTLSLPDVPGYEIQSLLGEGGMGVVYRAVQTALKRAVALKMIASEQVAATARRRFQTEAESIARLHHPNIVQIFEVGQNQGRPFLALELVEGGSLSHHLREHGPIPGRNAACLVSSLAHAIHHAHQQGIIHRDLKPANILLTRGKEGGELGQAKITDFGLAKLADDEQARTRSGAILGTPAYMAPEQAQGDGKNVSALTDVYALGAVLYECLTGCPPFEGDSSWDVLYKIVHSEAVPPSRHQPRLARDLDTICLKCLAKDPKDRYASAAELAADLDRFAAGEAISARPEGMLRKSVRHLRRRPITVAGALVLAGIAVLAVGYWSIRRGSSETDLREGREILRAGEAVQARDRFDRGIKRLQGWPGCRELNQDLTREYIGASLRDLTERLLFQHDPDHLDAAGVERLAQHCRAIWDTRDMILAYAVPEDPEWEARARADVRDIALRLSDVEVRLAGKEPAARRLAHEKALTMLDGLAELAPPALIDLKRRWHLKELGRELPALPELPQPKSATEFHLFGRAFWAGGLLDEAQRSFELGAILEPRAMALHFDRATLAVQRGRLDEAVESFAACLAIRPSPVIHSRRGFALLANADRERSKGSEPNAARDLERAEWDFTAALGKDGSLAEAYFGRAQVHHRRRDFDKTLADLQRALDAQYPKSRVLIARALALLELDQKDHARENLQSVLADQPDHAQAKSLLDRLNTLPPAKKPATTP